MSEFVRTAQELRGGLFLDEVSGELNLLVAAVRDTSRGGKLIVTWAMSGLKYAATTWTGSPDSTTGRSPGSGPAVG